MKDEIDEAAEKVKDSIPEKVKKIRNDVVQEVTGKNLVRDIQCNVSIPINYGLLMPLS